MTFADKGIRFYSRCPAQAPPATCYGDRLRLNKLKPELYVSKNHSESPPE